VGQALCYGGRGLKLPRELAASSSRTGPTPNQQCGAPLSLFRRITLRRPDVRWRLVTRRRLSTRPLPLFSEPPGRPLAKTPMMCLDYPVREPTSPDVAASGGVETVGCFWSGSPRSNGARCLRHYYIHNRRSLSLGRICSPRTLRGTPLLHRLRRPRTPAGRFSSQAALPAATADGHHRRHRLPPQQASRPPSDRRGGGRGLTYPAGRSTPAHLSVPPRRK